MNVPGFCKISDADYNRYASLFDGNRDYQFSWSEWYNVVRRNVNGNLVSMIDTESDSTTGFIQTFTEGAQPVALVHRGYVGTCPPPLRSPADSTSMTLTSALPRMASDSAALLTHGATLAQHIDLSRDHSPSQYLLFKN